LAEPAPPLQPRCCRSPDIVLFLRPGLHTW
jgi:hypothetical protein